MNPQEPAAPQDSPPGSAVRVEDSTIGGNFSVVLGDEHKHYHPAPEIGIPSLHQIPPPPADFTGREAELDELLKPMGQRGVNISGLAGMGGVGKTALALALADLIEGDYPDAQLFLDMRGASDQPRSPANAMESVVRAFHPTAQLPEDEEALRRTYLSVLDGKRALLLLDNARDRAQVAPLLPPESCALIVTSRQYFVLPKLHPLRLDILSPEEAKALLQKIAPRLSDTEAEEMAALCGYLPLALTLAGSALAERPDLTSADYLRRLADEKERLGLAEASLSLSYNLLDEAQQQRWRMLAVFPASFHRFVAAVIWGMEVNGEAELDQAAEHLSILVRYSLVEWREAEHRYRLHDLARLFSDAQLNNEERATTQLRHAECFLFVLAAAQQLYLKGGDAIIRALELIDAEWPNIQAGQTWTATHSSENDVAAALCSNYSYVGMHILTLRQHAREQIRWLESALAAARRLEGRPAEGAHLTHLGRAYAVLGEVRQAIDYCKQALAIALEIGDRHLEGANLRNLGNAYFQLGEVRQTIDYYQQDLTLAREIGDRRGEGNALGNLGNGYVILGEVQQAIDYYQQAIVIAREMGDRLSEGYAIGSLGNGYAILGEVQQAINYYQEAIVIAREMGDRPSEANTLFNMSLALDKLGDRPQSISLREAALGIYGQIEDPNAVRVRRTLAAWRGEEPSA